MRTIDFKTKSEIVPKIFPCDSRYWIIGLDIGYSSVKGVCPNKYFSFPSYAKKVPADRMSFRQVRESDIQFEMDGEVWNVGALAYDEVVSSEVMDSETELYGRDRYYSAMFKVISLTGLALSLMGNECGGPRDRKIIIQTGLPIKYMNDSAELRDVLIGSHSFRIKMGVGPWQSFDFSLDESSFLPPMPQPLGALLSASTDIDGLQTEESVRIFSSNVFVFDPGFGTIDTCAIIRGNIIKKLCNTFPELGMREVFARTCADIHREYHMEIDIPALQNKLADGKIRSVNRKKKQSEIKDFSLMLEKNCIEVFRDMIATLDSVYNYMEDYDYIIASGGTYEAWKDVFIHEFRNMEGIKIISANINDRAVPNIYSVARGYFFFANGKISRT